MSHYEHDDDDDLEAGNAQRGCCGGACCADSTEATLELWRELGQRPEDMFQHVDIAPDGGLNKVDILFTTNRAWMAMLTVGLIAMNVCVLFFPNFLFVRDAILDLDRGNQMRWKPEVLISREDAGMLLVTNSALKFVFGWEFVPEVLVAVMELTLLLVMCLRLLKVLIKCVGNSCGSCTDARAFQKWHSVGRLFFEHLRELKAISALKFVGFLAPAALVPAINSLIEDLRYIWHGGPPPGDEGISQEDKHAFLERVARRQLPPDADRQRVNRRMAKLQVRFEEKMWWTHFINVWKFVFFHIVVAILGFDAFVVKFSLAAIKARDERWWFVVISNMAFLNQMLGVVQVEKVLRNRLLAFIFGGPDGKMQDVDAQKGMAWRALLMQRTWETAKGKFGAGKRLCFPRFWFVSVMMTFNDLDFQKMVLLDETETDKEDDKGSGATGTAKRIADLEAESAEKDAVIQKLRKRLDTQEPRRPSKERRSVAKRKSSATASASPDATGSSTGTSAPSSPPESENHRSSKSCARARQKSTIRESE